jgi:hypothetical protein
MGGLYIGNAALVAFLLGDERRQSLSRTLWGRIFLRFGKPVPFMLYVMADIAIPVGAYLRDLQVVGAGILLIIIALALPHKASSRIRKRDYEQLVRAIVGVNEPLMQPHQSVRQRRSSSR